MNTFKDDLELVIGCATQGNLNLKFPFYISEATSSKEIDFLNLGNRSYNSLKRNDINTIGDFVENFDKIRSLRNLGVKSTREIRGRLCAFLYECMSKNERKYFWKEFIALNAIKGISTA